ncbi:hypothetical protein [Vitiosangium sp. GDMCC 1.1324]|uniref:hypothetical protein n=1 Tax=Vitiosangium sp. (strain GDMCC 1.1324) TaxID=2138576 RepID=UPI0011B6FD9C|nr:hypothetical protein [Vitiosangium sp. GDMCC 1.1324]
MRTKKAPVRSRKARRVVAVAGGVVAALGLSLQLASGGVDLAERVLTLVVKARQVLAGDASAAASGTCEQPKK